MFNPERQMIAKHRKVHLFDINIPGKIYFQESETLSPGNSFTSFETPFCRLGIGICYDICFAEMTQIYVREGCNVLITQERSICSTGLLTGNLCQECVL